MVSAVLLVTRQNCVSPCSIWRTAGVKVMLFRLRSRYQDAMAQFLDRRLHVLDSVHYQGPRSAPQKIPFGQSVNVRVIPVKSGRLIGRKREAVLEGVAGIDERSGHIVPPALGGNV